MRCEIAADLAALGDGASFFESLARMEGEVYREVARRRTFRFEHGGEAYFAKLHFGVGWREIFKNLLSLRLPVVSAESERKAIARLRAAGVPTMEVVGFFERGSNPATRQSVIVTRELKDSISLETLFLQQTVPAQVRRRLVEEVARLTRMMHQAGVNHRDLYICHFHVDQSSLYEPTPRLHVIDLHRAQVRPRTPQRWLVKDIAGLLFSSADIGLSSRDYLRFVSIYSAMGVSAAISRRSRFWHQVVRRACRLYVDEFGQDSDRLQSLQAL